MDLIHDESSNMMKQSLQWEALVDPSLQEKTVGYDRRTITFPIAINSTRFERSVDWAGLQLADIIAGTVARYCNWIVAGKNTGDKYAVTLSSYLDKLPMSGIWPVQKFTPSDLETDSPNSDDLLEYLNPLMIHSP